MVSGNRLCRANRNHSWHILLYVCLFLCRSPCHLCTCLRHHPESTSLAVRHHLGADHQPDRIPATDSWTARKGQKWYQRHVRVKTVGQMNWASLLVRSTHRSSTNRLGCTTRRPRHHTPTSNHLLPSSPYDLFLSFHTTVACLFLFRIPWTSFRLSTCDAKGSTGILDGRC